MYFPRSKAGTQTLALDSRLGGNEESRDSRREAFRPTFQGKACHE